MAVFRRVANLFRRSRIDREISDELQSHIDLRIDANIAAGMSPEAARRDALLRFGNPTSTRERVASADTAFGLSGFWRDIRYALRQLRKSPGFTITVIATLAIGIGANVAIFSSMDAVILRPLAVPNLNRVVIVAEQKQTGGNERVALANFEDWARQSRSFEDLAVFQSTDLTLTGAGDATRIQAAIVSPGFFRVLRTPAFLGRIFAETEYQFGRNGVVVLNYGFWQRHFASNASVIGQEFDLDQREYTIVGVMPKTLQYPPATDVILPFAPTATQLADRTGHNYLVLGRLRNGIALREAQSELRLIAGRLAAAYPASNQGRTVRVEPLLDEINGEWTPLYYKLIMGGTLFVLLIVCANIANLQLARGVARRPEIAMRTALGAQRRHIVRQMLTENVLLAVVGAAGGVGIGALYLHILLVSMPARIARYMSGWSNTSLNSHALAFSIVLAGLTGILAGIAPIFGALRVNVVDQLKAGSRGTTGATRARLRSVFAIAQICVAVALVIGAALMSKGMLALLHLPDIYHPDHALIFNISLPAARYQTPQKQAEWFRESLAALRTLPGVTTAEVTSALPYSDNGWLRELEIENRPAMPGKFPSALYITVSPGYFDALHLPIVDGRAFLASDSPGSAPVTVVSQRFVNQFFPNQNPLGHRIRFGNANSRTPWLTIVGVARETSYSLFDQNQYPAVYLDTAQLPPDGATYLLTTGGDPAALAPAARKALAALDPGLPLDGVETWERSIHDSLIGLGYAAAMLGIDALIALLLAAIGIFGVMANLVGERTREIGVRLAMGARKKDVLAMILLRASWLTGTGLVLGLVFAFILAHLVANLLRGVSPNDPVIFATVTTAIVAVAFAATWLPARQASRVDPMHALRAE